MKKSLACLVLLMAAASKGFQLQGPLDLISAQLGGPVLLPCSVETPLPLEELEVEWRRTDSDVLVHLFQEGEERPESQDYAYRGRAHFFSGELVRGNYSVELNNVTREDAGVYICKVYTNLDHSSVTAEVHFEHFLVTGAGVVSGYAGEEVVLHCSVDSHISPEKMEEVTWKRTDNKMLVLLYQDGEVISDSSDVQYRGRAELFPTEIPKGNFSLRLKDVRTEDRGEYICEAYSGDLSANTTVFLQELGFSNLHWSILVLCSISLLCTLVLIVPAWMSLQKKDTSQRSLVMHLSLILCPNILLGIGFILWGIVEGFLGEAAGCSTVNIIRFLLLIKTAPYLDILPGSFQKLKTLSVPAEYSIVTVVVYSVYFRNQQIMFESTGDKVFMGVWFGLVWFCVFAVIPDFRSPSQTRKGVNFKGLLLYVSSMCQIFLLQWGSKTADFNVLVLLFLLTTLLGINIIVLHLWLRIPFGYILWVTFMTIVMVLSSVLHIYYLGQLLERHKERAGLMAVNVLLQILCPLTFLDHPKKLPEMPHAIVYMLGASGLSIVNSITLLTELISKAETGERNVADLRVIVLLAESVYICCWMPLQLYSAWMSNRHRFQRNPYQRPPSSQRSAQDHEMETLNQRPLNGANE